MEVASFNPLVIGSSVLIWKALMKLISGTSFNPLVIGSSVLIQKHAPSSTQRRKFQSPSNRVKCSDVVTILMWVGLTERFNPLVIGSSVLMG